MLYKVCSEMEPEVWMLFIYSPLINPFVQYLHNFYHELDTLEVEKQIMFILVSSELKCRSRERWAESINHMDVIIIKMKQ